MVEITPISRIVSDIDTATNFNLVWDFLNAGKRVRLAFYIADR